VKNKVLQCYMHLYVEDTLFVLTDPPITREV